MPDLHAAGAAQIMQAMLLSLDEQHGGAGGSGACGSSASDGDTRPSAGAAWGGNAPGHFVAAAARARHGGAAGERHGDIGRPGPTAGLPGGAGAAAAAAGPGDARGSGDGAAQEDVMDSQLLAHAAALAASATGFWLGPPAGSPSQEGRAPAGGRPSSASAAADATAAAADAPVLEVRAVNGIQLGDSAGAAAALGQPQPQSPAALPTDLATAVDSAALADALAAANGWLPTTARNASRQQAAQAAARQPPPFVGMVLVYTDGAPAVTPPSQERPAGWPAAAARAGAASQPGEEPAVACTTAAGSTAAVDDEEPAAALCQACGAALMLQPDGSAVFVLLSSGAAAAEASPPDAVEGAAGVPLYELNCQVPLQTPHEWGLSTSCQPQTCQSLSTPHLAQRLYMPSTCEHMWVCSARSRWLMHMPHLMWCYRLSCRTMPTTSLSPW